MFRHSYFFSHIINLKISLLCLLCVVWVGEEGMEIKRQITGMMRLLSDKSGRVYQRVTTEQDSTTEEPQRRHLSWPQEPAPLPGNHQGDSWNSAGEPGPSPSSVVINPPNSPGCGQQGTGSNATRPKETKEPNKVHESHGRTELRRKMLISWWFCKTEMCCWRCLQYLSVYDNKLCLWVGKKSKGMEICSSRTGRWMESDVSPRILF